MHRGVPRHAEKARGAARERVRAYRNGSCEITCRAGCRTEWDLNAASDTARRRMFRRRMFRRSLSETMALPLSTVVRVLRERRVVEKLPLAWRTAVRPSLMRRCARGGPSVTRPPSGRAGCRLRQSFPASRHACVAARMQRRVGLRGIGRLERAGPSGRRPGARCSSPTRRGSGFCGSSGRSKPSGALLVATDSARGVATDSAPLQRGVHVGRSRP